MNTKSVCYLTIQLHRSDSEQNQSVAVTRFFLKDWGHGESPWSSRNQATPQGLDQRSYIQKKSTKSER